MEIILHGASLVVRKIVQSIDCYIDAFERGKNWKPACVTLKDADYQKLFAHMEPKMAFLGHNLKTTPALERNSVPIKQMGDLWKSLSISSTSQKHG